MVYQQFINYPHLNVFENIAFPLKQRKIDQSIIKEKVMDALKSVGLLGYENRKIQELSGGQQQRVSLARSLVKNAKILLLDEPLVNLDYKLREQLREEFKNLFSKGLADETILIYSTTDPRETMELNGEVIVLDEGKVLQVGPAKEIFENPNSLKVAEISNDPPMNIIEASIIFIGGSLEISATFNEFGFSNISFAGPTCKTLPSSRTITSPFNSIVSLGSVVE